MYLKEGLGMFLGNLRKINLFEKIFVVLRLLLNILENISGNPLKVMFYGSSPCRYAQTLYRRAEDLKGELGRG